MAVLELYSSKLAFKIGPRPRLDTQTRIFQVHQQVPGWTLDYGISNRGDQADHVVAGEGVRLGTMSQKQGEND